MVVNKLFANLKRALLLGVSRSGVDLTREIPLFAVDLRPGDIAIDCGANIGDITSVMAKSGAIVYAFEPNPYAFQVLSDRFIEMPNVHCINKGVLDRDDRMSLFLHENAHEDQVMWSVGSSLLDFKGNIDPKFFFDIDVIDLAQFIAGLNSDIKLVKIDVEGVEYQIIHHLIDTGLIKKIELLLVETHEQKIPELRKANRSLRDRIAQEGITNINLEWI